MNKLIFIFLIFVCACKKLPAPTDEFNDSQKWYENITVTSAVYENKIGNKLFFDLNVVAMKNSFTDFYYPDTAFKSYNQNGVTIDVQYVEKNIYENNDSYQTIVLIDQSQEKFKSYTGPRFVDALNRLNKFCKKSNDQYFGIGYFARDEFHGNSPVHYFKNETTESLYEHSEQDIMEFITENYIQLGSAQNSNLYDAINNAVDQLIETSLSNNKSVTIIFSNLDDGGSSITSLQLIQKCVANNIKINLISYDNANYNNIRMALETGGFMSQSGPIGLATATYHIHDLLANNKKEYTLKCIATKVQNWTSNTLVYAYLTALYVEEIHSPYFEEDLYNDLEIDQILPFYLKVQ